MLKYLILGLMLVSTKTYAESASLNLALPGLPQNFQQDKFRAGDLDCSNAIGSATQLEFGVTGIINDDRDVYTSGSNGAFTDIGVYGRIVIPLGARAKDRINCNDLYQLELQKKRLEVMKLERELEQLRALSFEN